MTEVSEGKLELDAKVYLKLEQGKVRLRDAVVYIHVKGYARARLTHLDIEHEALDNIIPPKRGRLHTIRGVKGGTKIALEKAKKIELKGESVKVNRIEVLHPHLNKILEPGEGRAKNLTPVPTTHELQILELFKKKKKLEYSSSFEKKSCPIQKKLVVGYDGKIYPCSALKYRKTRGEFFECLRVITE